MVQTKRVSATVRLRLVAGYWGTCNKSPFLNTPLANPSHLHHPSNAGAILEHTHSNMVCLVGLDQKVGKHFHLVFSYHLSLCPLHHLFLSTPVLRSSNHSSQLGLGAYVPGPFYSSPPLPTPRNIGDWGVLTVPPRPGTAGSGHPQQHPPLPSVDQDIRQLTTIACASY